MLRARIRILVIEEDPAEHAVLEEFFNRFKEQYRVSFADSVSSAKTELENNTFDVIVSEINFIDGHIFDLLPISKGIPFIIVTARGYEELAIMAIKRGVTEYIIRDIDGRYLEMLPEAILRAALYKHNNLLIDILLRALQGLDECVCIIDNQGALMFINKNFARLFNAGEDYYLKKIDVLLSRFEVTPLQGGSNFYEFLTQNSHKEQRFVVSDELDVVSGELRVIPVYKGPDEKLGCVLLGNCHAK